MSSTFLPNMGAALVRVTNNKGDEIGKGFVVSPWNTFLQQLVQAAPAVQTITTPSPFQANVAGTVIITSAGTVFLTRGSVTVSLGTGQKIIPISIGDIVSWTGVTTVQFWGA